MKVYCVFSLETSQQGDSNEYTQYTISQYKRENHSELSQNLHLWDLFQRTQERVRNSRGKRAISVRATQVLLYMYQNYIQNHSLSLLARLFEAS